MREAPIGMHAHALEENPEVRRAPVREIRPLLVEAAERGDPRALLVDVGLDAGPGVRVGRPDERSAGKEQRLPAILRDPGRWIVG